MAHGQRTGLLGVVVEITLGIVLGLFADDLDRVFIGADGAIRTQTKEQAADGLGMFNREVLIIVQAGMSNVFINADHEVVLRLRLLEFIEDGLNHGGGKFF